MEPSRAPEPDLDHDLLLAEIYAEVDRRRSNGELPAELERRLDRTFAELAPPGAVGDEGALLIERVERAAFIEPRVPLDQVRQPVQLIKRVLFKLMAWYVHFVTEQVSALGGSVAAALRGLDRRVSSLERGGPAVPARLRGELEGLPDESVPEELVTTLVQVLAGTDGRVLVADAGDGSLLRAVQRGGVDAYGAEPRRSRLPAALRDGIEVRAASALDHLRALPDGRLAAIVLTGAAADRQPPAAYAELVDEAARALGPGGRLVVLSRSVEAWVAGADGPTADLVPGRPLRPATWAHLLRGVGLTVDRTISAAPDRPLDRVDPATPGAAQLNELIDRIGPVVAPAPAYLLSATRPS